MERLKAKAEPQSILVTVDDRLRVGRAAARAEDTHGTPTQSHMSPSIVVYEDTRVLVYEHNRKLVYEDTGIRR